MLSNQKFALSCLERYADEGLLVDSTNGEFAHCPSPRGMGDAGYYLLHDDHQHQGLLQSDDLQRKCFFDGHAKRWLETVDPLPNDYFRLWDIYDKWSKAALYVCPDTGESRRMLPSQAEELGWVSPFSNKAFYVNPFTGDSVLLDPDEASNLNWKHVLAGTAVYRNHLTNECQRMTAEEALEQGFQFVLSGTSAGTMTYRNPENGQCLRLTPVEAELRGWEIVSKGPLPVLTCPHCGLSGGSQNLKRYHFDNCLVLDGGCHTPQPRVTCPHCGKTGGASGMKRWHFDNCPHANNLHS